MPAGILFWVIMIVALIVGGFGFSYGIFNVNLVLWVLLALLGWKVYGPILQ